MKWFVVYWEGNTLKTREQGDKTEAEYWRDAFHQNGTPAFIVRFDAEEFVSRQLTVKPDKSNEEFYLATFERTLQFIAGDYPNASKEYKRSSFVIGAQDMAMQLVENRPDTDKIAFAKKIDEIRNRIFPQ